jgi:hypothetical protein
MNQEELLALIKLLDYVEADERRHFEETEEHERAGHIYLEILKLKKFLKRQ